MPNDWRRFTGPDVSVPYSTYLPAAKNTGEQLSAILFPAHLDGKRADGRELSQSRPFSVLRTGVVSQAKGSAYIELGHTKVICSVFAPREIPNKNEFSGKGQLYCEVKYAMFACARRRPHAPEADERELSAALRRALEPPVFMNQFPNYQIDVMVQILQNDGGCLAAAITAAGLALADAGIPMMDLICACTLAVLDDRIFVDPTEAEENACLNKIGEEVRNHGVLTVAVTAEYERICHTVLNGSMDAECVSKCLDLLLVKCTETLLPEVQSVLMTSTEKAVEEKNKALELSKDKDEFLRKTVRDFKEKFNL